MRALPFVGRRAILAEIGAALAAAGRARGGIVVLTGAAGAGKTRIAAEVAEDSADVRVVWAWCPPDGGGAAFWPWSQILRDLTSNASTALRAIVTGQGLGTWDEADRRAARGELTGAVAEVLRTAAEERVLLIVVDDVQYADASSVRLLLDLVGVIRTARVLVLATARDDELAWQGRTAERAALLGRATCLPVGPLSSGDVAELISAATGREPGAAEVSAVVKRTGGEAFFVTELVRHDLSATVPASVRAAVDAHLAALPADTAAALGTAAVLGERFGLDVLADVMGTPLQEARALLDSAVRAGLLAAVEAGSASFRHQLLRDAAYDALTPADRVARHVRAAEVLAEYAERGREPSAAQVARHLLLAGPEHAAEAARFARVAGDRAAGLLAFEDALAWYERAASVLGDDPELLVVRGNARLGMNDRSGARADFLRAADLAADPEVLARAALGLGATGFEVGLLDREQIDLLERAASRVEEPGLLAAITARLSVASTLIESEERRLRLAEQALTTARRSGSPSATAQALAALCDACSGPAHRTDRREWATEIVELARSLADLPLELLGRRLRLVALLEGGETAAADAEVLAFEAAARTLNQPLYSWYVPLWRGMRALAEGRFADCRAALDQAEELGRLAGSDNAAMLVGTQRWCLLAATDRGEEYARLIEAVHLDEVPGVWPRVSMALVAAQLGDPIQARDLLSAVAPRLAEAPRDSEWLPMLAQVAETVGVIGPHPVCRQVYDWLTPYADCHVIEGIGAAVRGPVHFHLALLADALGDHDAAGRHRALAVEAALATGSTWLVAQIKSETVATPGLDTFTRDGDVWLVRFAGREVRLTASKGLQDLAVLVARPGTPVPAVELAGGNAAGGDLGEVVDATARQAYRKRLLELEDEERAADATGDVARSTRVAEERAALLDQLSAAYGLGGRARRTGSPAERARTAVTARIRAAVDRIGKVHPELGRHLTHSVRTGTVCVYQPEDPHTWKL